MCLELYQSIHPASNKIDSIQSLFFELLKLEILALQLSELLELLIKFFMEGVEHSGLEGQGGASDGEDADGEYSLEEEHSSLVLSTI